MAEQPGKKVPVHKKTGDTILRSKTLIAHRRDDLVEEIHRQAQEAERKKRQEQAALRRRKLAARQKRREILMFCTVVILVAAVFLVDALVKKPGAASAGTYEETAKITESPAAEAAAQGGAESQADSPVAAMHEGVGSAILAECHTDGVGSKNRYNNLQVACRLLNGYVLESGATFSFNDAVGERTAEQGFLEASVYTTAENNLELGGGICQVASTIYDCALISDLQIDERTAHIYTVEYVPYGLDATINWGSLDLKFTNNTKYPIELQTAADESGVTVRFLGTKTSQNTIQLSSEVVNTYYFDTVKDVDNTKDVGYSEWETLPKNGYDVFSYQDVYNEKGELLEHRFVTASYYQKIDLVIRVGPNT